ncbi:hypothetical protein ACFE33_15005 [Falsihalocynthiibacter sp. SS001]|uniref:hypothetical protein n=1 Tax=Falsihalocynthiibacter sp. SS001 TaxID=3349698 RepID=UPI0036D2A52D
MALIADILLISGALGAAIYCLVLSKRLNKFNDLEKGVGGAVALMSAQVDGMTKTLAQAQNAAKESTASLTELTQRAEKSAQHLELLVASLHDIPQETTPNQAPASEATPFLRHRETRG